MRKYTLLVFAALALLGLTLAYQIPRKKETLPRQRPAGPLSRPGQAVLIWENDENFLKIRSENNAKIRMAAFRTTLPDPLPGEEFNVGLAAKILAGTVIQPHQIFSMNQVIGPRTRGRGFQEGPYYSGNRILRITGGGICKVSTTLYNVAILADQDIIERKAHGMLVPYVPPGQDATVSYGTADFKFRNSTDGPIVIWAEKVDNTLYMAFYGNTEPPKVTWHHQVLSEQKEPVIYRRNAGLPPGVEKVFQKGDRGLTVKNWVSVEYPDGQRKTKPLGIDYYRPMPKIIEYNKD